VAAGNEDLNACNFQPASSEFSMTVGSVDKDDSRSSFSNWGECVSDIAIYSIILLLTIAEATLLTFPTFFLIIGQYLCSRFIHFVRMVLEQHIRQYDFWDFDGDSTCRYVYNRVRKTYSVFVMFVYLISSRTICLNKQLVSRHCFGINSQT
jgi:hypothetical protein